MNIAFVLAYLGDRFGGPVTVVKNLGSRLVEREHTVSYWATVDGADQARGDPPQRGHAYGIGWPRAWYRSKALARGLSEGIPSVDIVHINELWPYPIYVSAKLARENGVPYVLCPSGSLEPWSLRSTRLKWLKKAAYLRVIGKSIMRHSACMQACSTQEAEHFRQVGYEGAITIIPNGVDTSEFFEGDCKEAETYWPNLEDRPTLLFMSRLSPEKGLDILIPVWARLIKSPAYEDALLVIAGPDDRGYQKVVEAMIAQYGLQSNVFMTGMVQGRKKRALLRRADVFVLPSYSENFGIVVAEALACGTPVITTTATPWSKIEDIDAGRWVSPERSALFEALRELLDMSESQRAAMGRRGMTLVKENYTWDKIAGKFLNVCNCILQGRSIPLHPDPTESFTRGT